MYHTLSLIVVAVLSISLFAGASFASSVSGDSTDPVLVSPPQEIVDQAIAMNNIRYGRKVSSAHTNGAWSGAGYITLAVASYAGNESADKTLLKRIRYNLVGENTITSNGTYPAQHERHFTGACTLAKLTPRVWKQLSKAERQKIDLLMKAALVASAYTTSDASYAAGVKVYGIDGNGNHNRNWNPNYREGMIGMMLVGPVYFGPEKATEILDTYDHDRFVKLLRSAKLDNTYETFNWKKANPDSNAPTGDEIEKMVKEYRHFGLTLESPMAIYYKLTMRTYDRIVNAGLNGGKGVKGSGRIATGAEGLPNVGKKGMLHEFDGIDGGGPRSSIGYAYDGFRPNLTNHIVLIVGGYWQSGEEADECMELLPVGIEDLFYKLEHGYLNYSKGKGSKKVSDINRPHHDFALPRSLWNDVVKVYHGK